MLLWQLRTRVTVRSLCLDIERRPVHPFLSHTKTTQHECGLKNAVNFSKLFFLTGKMGREEYSPNCSLCKRVQNVCR